MAKYCYTKIKWWENKKHYKSFGGFMGVYSNIQIKKAIENGHIVCVPFNPKHISEASLDITLGYYYYRTEVQQGRTLYNPFDREDVERYFDGPYKALPHEQWAALNGFKTQKNIPLDHPVIALRPGERILAHSHEFFGINPPGASELRSRSSWGRNGVAVCFDAGWIDPGYINRLTLEIYNLNQHETIILPVGERIGQIIFHETGPVEGNYSQGRRGFSGKYQQGSDLNNTMRTWNPNLILPRAYKDKRIMPQKIEGIPYE
jgi:deoxycytidine triphosphate deaminase